MNVQKILIFCDKFEQFVQFHKYIIDFIQLFDRKQFFENSFFKFLNVCIFDCFVHKHIRIFRIVVFEFFKKKTIQSLFYEFFWIREIYRQHCLFYVYNFSFYSKFAKLNIFLQILRQFFRFFFNCDIFDDCIQNQHFFFKKNEFVFIFFRIKITIYIFKIIITINVNVFETFVNNNVLSKNVIDIRTIATFQICQCVHLIIYNNFNIVWSWKL